MKFIGISIFILISTSLLAQKASFPESWTGNWKGELVWYKTGKVEPQKVNMELRIQKADTGINYTWHIIYGSPSEDSRPYILIPVDTSTGHWVIDELSGIKLDQFWVGNKFSGAFTVQSSTIINSYWIEADQLHIEFYSIGTKPMATTGMGTKDVPFVDSYKMGSYQKAVLKRVK